MAAIAICHQCAWRSKPQSHGRAESSARRHRCSERTPRDTTPRCQHCSWTGKTTTAGLAAHAQRLHRCEREQWRQEMAARVEARRTASGPYRACKHKVATHHHGTNACYVLDRCRCRPCRNAAHDAEVARRADRARGVESYVDAEPVREHIRALQAQGLGLVTLSRLSGCSGGTLNKLLYGTPQQDKRRSRRPPCKRVRPATAQRILAVRAELDTLGQTAMVDAGPTVRKLQALVADGYSIAWLGRRLANTSVHTVFVADQVYARTARRVRDLYAELDGIPPRADDHRSRISVTRARSYAAEHGWLPGDAWEDIDAGVLLELDDDIDEIVVQRLVDGQQCEASKAERNAAYERLEARGYSARQIAEVLGGASRTVQRVRARRAS